MFVYIDSLSALSARLKAFSTAATAVLCVMLIGSDVALAESQEQEADRELEAGHYKEACQLYRIVLATNRQNTSVLLNAAKAYEGAGNLDEAIRTAKEAVASNKENPLAHFSLGHYLDLNRDDRSAMMQFQEVLDLKNVNPAMRKAAYGPILRLSKKLNEYPLMLKYAKDGAHEFAKDADCHYNFGWALSQMPNTKPKEFAKYQKEAVTEYQKAVELGVQRSDVHLKLATLLEAQNDRAGAKSALAKYINLAPDALTLPAVTALQKKLEN